MGIKSFFRNIGRGIKSGFNKLVSGIGGAGEFIQRKAIPALASGANSISGLISKASPLIDMAGPEASALAGEASSVAGQVGSGLNKFASFIGSDVANKPPVVANAQQIMAFSQSPFGMAIRKSQGLKGPLSLADATTYASGRKPAPAPVDASAIRPAVMPAKPSVLAGIPFQKGLISPAPMGSNPASYSPVKASGIEAKPAGQSSIQVAGGGGGAPMMTM